MMSTARPMQGSGHFQWNKGGWFGSLLGGTAWMLPTGLIFLGKAPALGMTWLAIYLALFFLGLWLWTRREVLDPFRSIECLLAAIGIGSGVALVATGLLRPESGLPVLTVQDGHFLLVDDRSSVFGSACVVLILVAILMGWFALLERSARNARTKSARIETSP